MTRTQYVRGAMTSHKAAESNQGSIGSVKLFGLNSKGTAEPQMDLNRVAM